MNILFFILLACNERNRQALARLSTNAKWEDVSVCQDCHRVAPGVRGHSQSGAARQIGDAADFRDPAAAAGVGLNDIPPLLTHDISTSKAEINQKPSDYAPLTEVLYLVLCEWVLSKREDLEVR